MDAVGQLLRNARLLVVHDERQVPVLRIGVRAMFHDVHGWRSDRRAAVVACHDRYLARHGARLRFQTHPDTGRFSRVRAGAPRLPDYLDKLREGDGYEMLLHDGAQPWAAPEFAFETSCASRSLFPLGHVAMSWGLEGVLEDIEGFVDEFDGFVRALAPLYAHADIAILPSPSRRDLFQHIEYAWARGAWGLDVETYSNRRYLEQTGLIPANLQTWGALPDPTWLRVKGFNWLVYLNGDSCAQLGGRAALLRSDGRDGIAAAPLGDGLRLRAGALPYLMPHAAGRAAEVPPAYTAQSALLKPLRTEGLALAQGAWFEDCVAFDESSSRRWQARFDPRPPRAPAPWPGD